MYRYAIYNKSSNIIKNFSDKTFEVYLGHKWGLLQPSLWHVGYKFGEFFRTRRYEIYRDKLSRKAEKKRREQVVVSKKKKRREREYKIEVIRHMKMFNTRRRLNLYKTEFKPFEIAPKRFYTPSKRKHMMV